MSAPTTAAALSREEIDALPALAPWGPLVAGVYVGGCVERGPGSSFRRLAHAHCEGAHRGWIYVRARRRLACRALMLHELAHVLTHRSHDDAFRRQLLALGGSLDPHPMGDLRGYHRFRAGRHAPQCPCHTTQPDARLFRRCCGAEIWDEARA